MSCVVCYQCGSLTLPRGDHAGSALLPIAALPLAATRCIVPEGPNVTAVSALARAASFAHAGGVHGVHRLLTQNAPEVVPCGDFDLAWLSWGIAFLALAFQAIGFMTCLPMVHTFMSNVAYAEIQGTEWPTFATLAFRAMWGVVFTSCRWCRVDPRHRIIVRRSSARNRAYGDRCCVLCDGFGAPTVLG